jgi:glutamate decarboxylase
MREIIGWEGGDSILAPGGSISNMYALMIARHKLFPQHKKYGMRAIKGQLIMYTSQHVSISRQYIHGRIHYKDIKTKFCLYWCLI